MITLNKEERIKLRDEIYNDFISLKLIIKYNYSDKTIFKFCSNKKHLNMILNSNIELKNKYNLYLSQFRTEKEGIYCLVHNDDISNHLCKICKKELSSFRNNRYSSICNNRECFKSIHKNEDVNRKRENTCMEKYGVKNVSQSKSIKEKIINTNLERYGSNSYLGSEKYKNDMLELYNVDNPTKSKEIQEKIKFTNLERYGKEYIMQIDSFKEKSKNSLLEKYNVEHPAQSKEVLNKMKQTCLYRYGEENCMKNNDIKDRWKESYYSNNNPINSIEDIDVQNIKNDISTLYNKEDITLSNIYLNDEYFMKFIELLYIKKNRLLRLVEVSNIFNVYPQTINRRIINLSIEKYFYIKDSALELNFKEILDKFNIKYKRHNRDIIKNDNEDANLEIDFILSDYNIGIEIDDIESHNIKKKDINYHINKVKKAKENGIRLIHIWEWEINEISNWIEDICNNNKEKVFARKCIIKLVSIEEEKDFLNKYNLYKYIKSDICIGLYYNNELIQVLSFKKIEDNNYEILRMCTKYNNIVIGGSKKLLTHFIKSYNFKSIISYCDLSKFTGDSYCKLGFKLIDIIEPKMIKYKDDSSIKLYDCGYSIYKYIL